MNINRYNFYIDIGNSYTRVLEEKVVFLEQKLQSGPSQNAGPPDAALLRSPQPGSTPSQAASFGLDRNPVGDIVGLLALSSSEAPAYVGSSSGLSLAANLGEMVQASVWNQFISKMESRKAGPTPNNPSTNTNVPASGTPPQPGPGARTQDRSARTAERSGTNVEPPCDEMGAKIIDTYFRRMHTRYPFVDRRQIWRLHEERWRLARTQREDLTRADRFAIFKLNMVYAIGATMLQLSEKYAYTAPEVSFVLNLPWTFAHKLPALLHYGPSIRADHVRGPVYRKHRGNGSPGRVSPSHGIQPWYVVHGRTRNAHSDRPWHASKGKRDQHGSVYCSVAAKAFLDRLLSGTSGINVPWPTVQYFRSSYRS